MRSKSRAKRSNTELNPLIGDFINTIGQTRPSRDVRDCPFYPQYLPRCRRAEIGSFVPILL
jgi:hypothetical protein